LGISVFMFVVILTIFSPFLSYLLLLVFKPMIDSLYSLRFGFLKITHLFSVYSIVVWSVALFTLRRVRHPFLTVDLAHLLLLAPVPLILLLSPNIGGIDLALRILSGWGFYYMAREMDEGQRLWTERALVLSALFPAVMGLLALMGYLPGGFQEGAFRRLKGPYHDATAFGFELVPGFLVLLYRLRRRFNPLDALFVILILVLLYNTYTRGLWVSLFLAAMLIAFGRGSGRGVFPKVLIGVMVVGLLVMYPDISARFSHHGLGTDPDSFNGRMLIWGEGFRRFRELPLLHSVFGLITVGKPMGLYLHNTYLVFLIDLGIFGFVVFSLWMAAVAAFVVSYSGRYASLLRAAFVFVVITGLTSGGILYPNFQWFFLTVLGFAVGDKVGEMKGGVS